MQDRYAPVRTQIAMEYVFPNHTVFLNINIHHSDQIIATSAEVTLNGGISDITG